MNKTEKDQHPLYKFNYFIVTFLYYFLLLFFLGLHFLWIVLKYIYFYCREVFFGCPPKTEEHLAFWSWYASWYNKEIEIPRPDLVTKNNAMTVVETERKIICYPRYGVIFTSLCKITSKDGEGTYQSWDSFG